MAMASAVAAWLIANVAIAWSLRARPGLPLRRNIAFPAWALLALVAAFILSLTQAGATLGVATAHGRRRAHHGRRRGGRCGGRGSRTRRAVAVPTPLTAGSSAVAGAQGVTVFLSLRITRFMWRTTRVPSHLE